MHIAEILEVRWMGPGVLQRIKTYAWNCVTYLPVVCILFCFPPTIFLSPVYVMFPIFTSTVHLRVFQKFHLL